MIIGIYKSCICENQFIQKPTESKLDIEKELNCAWCNKLHKFYLTEVFRDGKNSKVFALEVKDDTNR